ncbi:MAG: hypothetical protein ABL999_04505 [Pyrinomonadaceae bacterium]
MGVRQCEKCSEIVDEAKAFCPGCGQAFVAEEKRSQTSNFDTMDNTVQLGQTMYNQMLSDMGLNISKAPDPVEKRIEVIAPVPTTPKPQPVKPPTEPKPSANKKWIIAALLLAILLFLFAIAAAAILFIYWVKFR